MVYRLSFSSFYLSPFLMVVSASLRFLYSFLYRVHQLYSTSWFPSLTLILPYVTSP
jgi:hypothetical protein